MYKGDGLYEPGETWKQPDLAKTLARIRDKGREGFYSGETAEKLVTFMTMNGGLITKEDLAAYEAIERKPLTGSYRGYTVHTMPPVSSGGITLLEMLNILEGYDLNALGYKSADYIHVLAETMKRAYADRAEYLGDPAFNPDMPVDRLISKEYAASLRTTIRMDLASIPDSSRFNHMYEGDNTTHLSVVDKEGNAVSLTYTLEYSYGCQIVADGLGFFLNNEMGDFNPVPGLTNSIGLVGTKPNLIQPGKRMLSSMTPTILTKDGKVKMVIGSPGGRTIINTVLQVILNVVDHEMNIAQAVEAPRLHHQWLPNRITYEYLSISPDTRKLLEARGHTLLEWPPGAMQGMAMGIVVTDGVRMGAADSRGADAGAAGY
jgi:gamma-glutamyltranspeptidase/glutathione hydrolase